MALEIANEIASAFLELLKTGISLSEAISGLKTIGKDILIQKAIFFRSLLCIIFDVKLFCSILGPFLADLWSISLPQY